MTDITSAFRGITTPHNELYEQIQSRGWEVTNVGWSKSDKSFVAVAKSPHGEQIQAVGPTDQTALGNLVHKIVRRQYMRSAQRFAAWNTTFTNKMEDIAEAYAKAPVYDPKAAGAWRELGQDSLHRADIIRQQLEIEVTDEPEPYTNAAEMCKDIHKGKYTVSRANADHPVWSVDEVVAFRIVHDVMGHCASGGDFGWDGENLATAAHMALLSPTAQKALFTERIGSMAYALHTRGLGPHKIAFLDEHIEEVQAQENPAAHRGIHPSQTVVPGPLPTVPVVAAVRRDLLDPNHKYQTGIDPVPGYNAYMEHGDPLEAKKVLDTASLIDTKWSKMDPNKPSDRAVMKQAIVNAFRVVLLSPRKDLRWNAVHYQDISHVPAEVTDPKIYWDALEEKRRSHNVARGRHPDAHLTYWKPRKRYYQLVQSLNPDLSWDEVVKKTDTQIFHWRMDEEIRLHNEDARKPPSKQKSTDAIEREANKIITERLKAILGDEKEESFDPETDIPENIHPDQETMFAKVAAGKRRPGQVDVFTGEDAELYGAFMGTHLKAIAEISQHADEILDAALEDVQQHDGSGHHFRNKVLQLGVSGVGPKVASFSWLLLQPLTSQLATIDTHMMDVLGHDYEKEMNHRDYFKFERELQAGRDASGYGHVPLGAFQWGMWDHKRTGPGTHQDHSAMKVLDPKPHMDINWVSKQPNTQLDKAKWAEEDAPEWWRATEGVRNQVGQHFDETLGASVPKNRIPHQQVPKMARTAREPGTWGKDFSHWWDRFKPFSKNEAKKMAEYAAATKMTKAALKEYISDHRQDIRGEYDEFVDALMRKFDRINRESKAPPRDPWVPWLHDAFGFRTGVPGQSYAKFLREALNIAGPEFWKIEGASLGKYNPQTRELIIGAGKADEQEILENLSVLHYEPKAA